jgi:hypothetical protein
MYRVFFNLWNCSTPTSCRRRPYASELARRPTRSRHKAAPSSPSPRVAARELGREAM